MNPYPVLEGLNLSIHPKATLLAHPLAAAFPFMSEAAMKDHIDDIREQGQIEPIVMYEGQILDGRNTLFACMELGKKPVFREFGSLPNDGASPAHFVFSRNFHRRSLSPAQKAAVATNFIPFFEFEAKERQASTQFAPQAEDTGTAPLELLEHPGTGETPIITEPGEQILTRPQAADIIAPPESITTGSSKGRVRDKVAEAFGTSSGMVRIAQRLNKKAPDLFQAVLNGTMKAHTADAELDKRLADANTGEHAAKVAAERKDAIEKLRGTWPEKKFEKFLEDVENKEILKKHADLLLFADLAKTRALPLLPLVKLGWGPVRAQEFIDGKIEGESTVNDLFLAAVAQTKSKAGKPVEHVFQIITQDCGEYSNWTVIVQCDPAIKPAPVPPPAAE